MGCAMYVLSNDNNNINNKNNPHIHELLHPNLIAAVFAAYQDYVHPVRAMRSLKM